LLCKQLPQIRPSHSFWALHLCRAHQEPCTLDQTSDWNCLYGCLPTQLHPDLHHLPISSHKTKNKCFSIMIMSYEFSGKKSAKIRRKKKKKKTLCTVVMCIQRFTIDSPATHWSFGSLNAWHDCFRTSSWGPFTLIGANPAPLG
jgi:hypothetical protein